MFRPGRVESHISESPVLSLVRSVVITVGSSSYFAPSSPLCSATDICCARRLAGARFSLRGAAASTRSLKRAASAEFEFSRKKKLNTWAQTTTHWSDGRTAEGEDGCLFNGGGREGGRSCEGGVQWEGSLWQEEDGLWPAAASNLQKAGCSFSAPSFLRKTPGDPWPPKGWTSARCAACCCTLSRRCSRGKSAALARQWSSISRWYTCFTVIGPERLCPCEVHWHAELTC